MRLLHMVSSTQRRGAQVFTAQLVHALGDRVEQRVAVLHGGGGGEGVRFDAPTTVLPGDRLVVPGVGVSVAAVRRLRRLIEEWLPRVVQVSGGELLKHAVPAAAGRPVHVVYRRIGSATGRDFHAVRRRFFGMLLGRVSVVVAVAEEVRRETVDMFGLPPGRVVMIPGGRDPATMGPARGGAAVRRELGIPVEAPVLVWVGALTWEKDPVAAVELLSRVRRRRPRAVLLLSGDGPLRPAVDRAAGRLDDGAVHVLGSRSDVADLLDAADVLVVTSRTEGMPGSVIEAGMLGVPTVSYDLVGLPEAVLDGRTGLLVPAGDVEALAGAVVRVLENPEEARRLGEEARRHCLATFDMARVAERYLALYEDLR